MKQTIAKFLEHLRVKNSSPHTIVNYGKDLDQFLLFLSPPGAAAPAVETVTHAMIREFVAHLHEHGLEKSSIARKIAALRSFFKYCVRQGRLKENPARLIPTPKLPKRIPSVVSAEDMSSFLNQLAGTIPSSTSGRRKRSAAGNTPVLEEALFLPRDRALLELLYAAGLRVSELTGLNLADMEQNERILRVRGKGNKERIVPYGSKAQQALEKYWPLRQQLLL